MKLVILFLFLGLVALSFFRGKKAKTTPQQSKTVRQEVYEALSRLGKQANDDTQLWQLGRNVGEWREVLDEITRLTKTHGLECRRNDTVKEIIKKVGELKTNKGEKQTK